ncbi:MAG: hypothetical protein WAO35_03215 [Terriglobia bacterium]
MLSPRLAAFCAVPIALFFSSLRALASDKPVAIETIPAGAQVEVNGSVACVTPCSIKVPAYYFGVKHTAVSSHGVEPIRVKLTKQGYAPKSAELTTGPIHWKSLTGTMGYDYYLLSSDHFTFQLDTVKAAPVAAPAPEPQPSESPSSPAIVLASPPGASPNQTVESNESPMVIRGVATDRRGILLVTINGSAANMRPQNAEAAEFWSDPLPIKPGNTSIEISASNSAHVETKLAFTLHYTPKVVPPNPRALSKHEIVSLLQGSVPNGRVEDLIKERGLKFTPTADDLNDIRQAGANEDLIQAIQQAASPK